MVVEPSRVAVGGEVVVTVRPARPDGALLGPGHRVEVGLDPGGTSRAATDQGGGVYAARFTLTAPGEAVFGVTIDGVGLVARPSAWAGRP